ncbi:sigma-70 family RNA polymerase sigma factor [Mycobacterium xenopi]|nr:MULTISPECIES: sigma-70 family RNA polymerase sigma factor [Mycobacterium]MDA3640461.1 sigma-70 family RNA polymerase sigma factor [Mycobacterium xenopi]MDA3661215.1 sigma-70 family RNA polymerase sigma factor [Mycobacterium xenopi]PIJ35346.1 RNA polymerase subunit sigma-70 [Mycobacterium heckeshornense]
MRTPPTPSKVRSVRVVGIRGSVASGCQIVCVSSIRVSVLTERRDGDFFAQAEPYRRELLAHCYRMTGSLHDAEDLVQETYLRAWKAYDRFEGKSSVRTWLHRIATNTCLTALEGRQRRPLPSGLGAPSSDPTAELVERTEIAWLEPLPEFAADPSDIVGSRESVRLAFIAALQHLSPRQRAVLLLRDVLQWKAAEVAEAIGTSTAAVNSLLQRARTQLEAAGPSPDERLAAPDSAEAQDRLARYIAAFEAYDVDRLVELFTSEAVWEMPPYVGWYQGPQTIATLIRQQCPAQAAGDMRLIPLLANGQPAAAMYMRDGDRHLPFQLQVLDITEAGVSHVVAFLDTMLFPKFGLPASL